MDKILNILKAINENADFEGSTDFFEDGLVDSMGIMTLVEQLESTYRIEIEGEDIIPENLCSIKKIQTLLERYGV